MAALIISTKLARKCGMLDVSRHRDILLKFLDLLLENTHLIVNKHSSKNIPSNTFQQTHYSKIIPAKTLQPKRSSKNAPATTLQQKRSSNNAPETTLQQTRSSKHAPATTHQKQMHHQQLKQNNEHNKRKLDGNCSTPTPRVSH